MIICRVVDRSNNRKRYTLIDNGGNTIEISADRLRESIRNRDLIVTNVTMGSDGRIILNENKNNIELGNPKSILNATQRAIQIEQENKTKKKEVAKMIPYSLFDWVQRAMEISIDSIISMAKDMKIKRVNIPTECGKNCILMSEGTNHILCIPDGIDLLNNSIKPYYIKADYRDGVEIDEGVLRNLTFTKHLQNLRGNITVVGGKDITFAYYMFALCDFETIYLHHFKTKQILNTRGMFYGCKAEHIDLSHFFMDNAHYMQFMFANSYIKDGLNVSHFYPSLAVDMSYMFHSCKAHITGVLDFGFERTRDMTGMFANTSIDAFDYNVTKSNIENSKVMKGMFYRCNAGFVRFSDADLRYIYDMSYMFAESRIDWVDFSYAKFAVSTNMHFMFSRSVIREISFENITTSSGLDCYGMFYECTAIRLIWSNNIDKVKFKDTVSMFAKFNMNGILDLSDFDVSDIIDMSGMFIYCQVRDIILSSFNTANVRNMDGMFSSCQVEYLDLSSFNTANVSPKNLETMFWNYEGKIKVTDKRIKEAYKKRVMEELEVSNFVV